MAARATLQATTSQVLGLAAILALLRGVSSSVLAQPASPDANRLKTACVSNMKQTALALLMYTVDYDDVLPPSKRWMAFFAPYCKDYDVYACPCVKSQGPRKVTWVRSDDLANGTSADDYGYAYNSNLSMKHSSKLRSPAQLALTFESSNLKWNANDAGTSLLKKPRHPDTVVISFLDGHVKAHTVKDAGKVRFKP